MILTAALLPGSETPAGDGSTGALRCTLVLPDASRRAQRCRTPRKLG